jgi:hypothetical protein
VQRASASAARRQLVEQHPGVVFDLLQLLQEIGVLHARKLANEFAGRSRCDRRTVVTDSRQRLPNRWKNSDQRRDAS